MVCGKYKTKRFRKVFVRTPGAKTVIHYRQKKPQMAKCAECKKELSGIPRLIASKLKNLPKSKKKVQRPYGGNLCSKCTRLKLKERANTLFK